VRKKAMEKERQKENAYKETGKERNRTSCSLARAVEAS